MSVSKWFEIDGDNTLRLDYPLTKDSLVWDVGGYRGDWADKIHSKYGCHVVIFEPVIGFYSDILRRFEGNRDISVFLYGLSDRDGDVPMSIDKDSSSTLRGDRNMLVRMCDVKSVLHRRVALIKINIEGGEYDLLNRMIDTGIVKDFEYIQVQFHNFVEDTEKKRDEIREKLKQTHKLMWDYKFIWESWQRI